MGLRHGFTCAPHAIFAWSTAVAIRHDRSGRFSSPNLKCQWSVLQLKYQWAVEVKNVDLTYGGDMERITCKIVVNNIGKSKMAFCLVITK